MKKILLIGLFALISFALFAQTEADFEVRLNQAGDGVVITKYIGATPAMGRPWVVTIPETIQGMPVKELGAGVFNGKRSLWLIGTVQDAEDYRRGRNTTFNFQYTPPQPGTTNVIQVEQGLTHVILPTSLVSIGNSAFSNTDITSITIPEGVTSIGSNAFSGCIALTTINLPSTLTSVTGFKNCTALTTITIPESVTSIGNDAFQNCTALTTIIILKGVTSIGSNAFSGCIALTTINIPEGVTSIGSSAFQNCTALTTITLPSGLIKIETSTFAGSGLTSITIPEGVTEIAGISGYGTRGAFQDCTALITVNLPSTIRTVGQSAFSGCTALTTITIPEGVERIQFGRNVFEGVTRLNIASQAVLRRVGATGF